MPGVPSEFEEKEFEAPLYNQLECGTRLVWSPGLVFEQYVGFDRAMFLYDPALWHLFGASRPPIGVLSCCGHGRKTGLRSLGADFLW